MTRNEKIVLRDMLIRRHGVLYYNERKQALSRLIRRGYVVNKRMASFKGRRGYNNYKLTDLGFEKAIDVFRNEKIDHFRPDGSYPYRNKKYRKTRSTDEYGKLIYA